MRTLYSSVIFDEARRSSRRFRRVGDAVRRNPLIGHAPENMEPIRELSILRTPFSFIYRAVEDRMDILRVWGQRGDSADRG